MFVGVGRRSACESDMLFEMDDLEGGPLLSHSFDRIQELNERIEAAVQDINNGILSCQDSLFTEVVATYERKGSEIEEGELNITVVHKRGSKRVFVKSIEYSRMKKNTTELALQIQRVISRYQAVCNKKVELERRLTKAFQGATERIQKKIDYVDYSVVGDIEYSDPIDNTIILLKLMNAPKPKSESVGIFLGRLGYREITQDQGALEQRIMEIFEKYESSITRSFSYRP